MLRNCHSCQLDGRDEEGASYIDFTSALGASLLSGDSESLLFNTEYVLEIFKNTELGEATEIALFERMIGKVIEIAQRDNDGRLSKEVTLNEFIQIVAHVREDRHSDAEPLLPILNAMDAGIVRFRAELVGQEEYKGPELRNEGEFPES